VGKHVDVLIDDDLPGTLRRLPAPGEVDRTPGVTGDHDLVVMLDVADQGRVGRAAALVRSAPAVLVVDHHPGTPSRETVGVAPGAELTTWVVPGCPATALLVADLVELLVGGADLDAATWKSVAEPLLAGAITDTGAFSHPGIEPLELHRFKGLLRGRFRGEVTEVEAKLAYAFPAAAAGLLSDPPVMSTCLPEPPRDVVERALAAGHVRVVDQGGVHLATAPGALVEAAVLVARLEDPEANRNDVTRHLCNTHLGSAQSAGGLAVLLREDGGHVACEFRSRDAGRALDLATLLGGGGHPRAAAARVEGSLDAVRVRVEEALRAWSLEGAPDCASGAPREPALTRDTPGRQPP
jgi:hypothetical protein